MLNYARSLPYGLQILGNSVVRKTAQLSSKNSYDFLKLLVTKQIRNPDPAIVPVYKFRNIGFNRGTYRYQYDMLRMGMLSQEEKHIVTEVSIEWHDNKINIASSNNAVFMKARKEYPKLMAFLEEQTYLDRYWDLHSGNVMMDEDRNYRFIDLEGFIKGSVDDKKNEWIRQ